MNPLQILQGHNGVDLFGLPADELSEFLEDIGVGSQHTKRVFRSLHGTFLNLAKDPQFGQRNAARINAMGTRASVEHVRTQAAPDGSSKLLFRLGDQALVEGVLIPGQRGRTTLCLSSQVGCGVGCSFCATGTMGLTRNLLAGEMMAQVHHAMKALALVDKRLSHVVFMGMGEPLQNYERIRRVIRILMDTRGPCLESRRITVSTVGIPRMMKRFGKDFNGRVQLALSLHAGTDQTRKRIIPLARTHPLAALREVLVQHPLPGSRHIMIEYVVLPGVNDSDTELKAVSEWTHDLRCIVNLVPFNPFSGSGFRSPTVAEVESVMTRLKTLGVRVSVRWPRGREIHGACGQLALTGQRLHPLPM